MTANQQMIVGALVGALIGGGITWFFAWAGTRQLRGVHADLAKSIGALQGMLADAIDALRKSAPQKADALAAKYEAEMQREKDAVSRLSSKMKGEYEASLRGPTQSCPQCGINCPLDGWMATPIGHLWHYRCPVHGRFPGADVKDMMDD